MARNFPDWLKAYCDYASYTEAPRHLHFWVAVSTIAGALRRKVWIDQYYFKWYANFYVILVAPPGIVSKSSTADIGMRLLRKVPGVNFGPDVVTWQALVKAFAECSEGYAIGDPLNGGRWETMSAMTICSTEMGNLLNPQDRDMIDLLVTLWDGKQGAFQKITKMSGNDTIENPWINIIACTTPSWIAGNFPEYLVGGGFTSRCIFVYAEEKLKYVPYPILEIPEGLSEVETALLQDLERISVELVGAYGLSRSAIAWGGDWYRAHYRNRPPGLDDDRFGGYIARKQTHLHKLAMVVAAATREDMVITEQELEAAHIMLTDLEKDMPQVFARIGQSEQALQAKRFLDFLRRRGQVPYEECYRYLQAVFPDSHDMEGIITGVIRSGYVKLLGNGPTDAALEWIGPVVIRTEPPAET